MDSTWYTVNPQLWVDLPSLFFQPIAHTQSFYSFINFYFYFLFFIFIIVSTFTFSIYICYFSFLLTLFFSFVGWTRRWVAMVLTSSSCNLGIDNFDSKQ